MVIKNALMTVGVRVTLIVAGLATTIITARWLGPAGRGDYFFVVALSAIAGQVVHLGLHASNAFYVAKDPKLFGALAVNSYWVSVVPASIAAVLFPVLMKLGIDRWRETLRYMTILMGLALLVALVVGVFSE